MTDLMTHFDISMREQLDRIRDRVETMKDRVIPENSDLDIRLELLGEDLDAQRERLSTALESLEDFVKAKTEDLRSNFWEWRDERKIDELSKDAEHSERRATAALNVAISALDEAEVALTASAIAQDTIEFLQNEDD